MVEGNMQINGSWEPIRCCSRDPDGIRLEVNHVAGKGLLEPVRVQPKGLA